ncbi:PTS sugar transporter subunit IIA [Sporosarcina cascadiensis]|uniref:PTS sugar transporter subunit IIA n=1 Tax=Sporosarcina cascadiensis TaxID=2660747 RepID=UPI001890FA1B|nr:PTS sugar transporter subunit IIA [Sporosarcina cascadiensis]
MYVEENLVFFNNSFEDKNELFDFMADVLEKEGYVTEEFREAIKIREENYPTGLKLTTMNVAIVHTEAIYSQTDKLVILKLGKPIVFNNIETLQPLEVDFIIGLILKDSEKHLQILKNVSQLLQSEEAIDSIKNTASHEELLKMMIKYFNEKRSLL